MGQFSRRRADWPCWWRLLWPIVAGKTVIKTDTDVVSRMVSSTGLQFAIPDTGDEDYDRGYSEGYSAGFEMGCEQRRRIENGM